MQGTNDIEVSGPVPGRGFCFRPASAHSSLPPHRGFLPGYRIIRNEISTLGNVSEIFLYR